MATAAVPVPPLAAPALPTPVISPFKTLDKVLQTVKEMLTDRGYTVLPLNSSDPGHIDDLRARGRKDDDEVLVYFATDVKVPVKKIREYLHHMEEHHVTHAIVVYAHQITPGARSELSQRYDIETFQAVELYENRTRHTLVPRHERLVTEGEVQEVMKKYHLKSKNDFPLYYLSDPVVRYYHWPPGTVVRIYRRLGGLKEPEVYYRQVRA